MVTPSSARTLSIDWQPPVLRYRNGIITNYSIAYYSSQWMHGDTIHVDGNTTSIVANKLIPFTTYNVTIRSATVIGFGPASNGNLVKTLQAGIHTKGFNSTFY